MIVVSVCVVCVCVCVIEELRNIWFNYVRVGGGFHSYVVYE